MSLSPIAFFGLLDENNPVGTDSRTISDDQHRNILASMKQQAPNWTAAVTATHGDVNLLSGYVAAGKKPLPGVGGQTVAWFYNQTVPPGYTLFIPDEPTPAGRVLLIGDTKPGGGGTGGTFGGIANPVDFTSTVDTTVSVNLPADTGGHALTAAENGPHGHVARVNSNTGNLGSPSVNYIASHANAFKDTTNQNNSNMIGDSGSGIPHIHPIGGTAAGTGTGTTSSVSLAYALGVMGTLDA